MAGENQWCIHIRNNFDIVLTFDGLILESMQRGIILITWNLHMEEIIQGRLQIAVIM